MKPYMAIFDSLLSGITGQSWSGSHLLKNTKVQKAKKDTPINDVKNTGEQEEN